MDEELIEKYIQGKLTAEEKQQVEKALAEDDELARQVAFEIGLKAGIEAQSHADTKTFLQEVETEEGSRQNNYNHWWYAAAGLVLLAMSYFMLRNEVGNQLFDEYYVAPQQFVVNVERGETAELTAEQKAYWHYDRKEYDVAKNLFLQLLKDDSDKADYHFYLGICYLETDEPQLALTEWAKISEGKWQEAAQWYSALCYLKMENKEQAITLLKRLQNKPGDYQEDATLLLDDL